MRHLMNTFLLGLLFLSPNLKAQTVKNIGSGTTFTCVSYDAEGNLWAGTRSEGLWKAAIDTATGKIESGGLSLFSSEANFNKYQIQTIATPTVNGKTSVWVGSRGMGNGTASGGGVHQFLTTSTTKAQLYIAERDKVVSKGMRLPAMKNDGTPSRDCKAIAVDKYGTVWSAHGYHDLTISGTVEYIINPYTGQLENYSVKGGYYVTPGGLGMKKADKPIFDNRSNLDEKTYPAYTVDTPIEKSAQTRIHLSLGTGNDQLWVSVAAYEDVSGTTHPTGIIKYDLAGNFYEKLDYTNTPELPFTSSMASPRAYSIHFQKNDTPWLTFNQNKGFAMMKNFGYTTAKWVYVDTLRHYNTITKVQEVSTLFASGKPTFSLTPGLIASSGRRVFLGTTAGLLVYDGHGDIKQDSSYTLITTAEGLSSNDIKGVTTGAGYVYVATSKGVDQIFVPSDLTIIHIDRKESPFDSKDKNYIEMSTMTTLKGMNNLSYNDEDLPMFSADGTTSSVFRYYTDDFDGFYQQEEKYLFGLKANYRNEDTAKYGKFILKPVEDYEDDKKEYVDIIFRHPMYVEEAFASKGEDAIYDFSIAIKNSMTDPVFKNYVKITTPPVLLVHGVWTDIGSLANIESSLLERGKYAPFKVLKIYKRVGNTKEKPYSGDANEIPNGIKRLIAICSSNNLSAGKASLVVHSRGGLYARAYVEELYEAKYNFDIHSLITLNTPHAGSQLANLVLDTRKYHVQVPKLQYYDPTYGPMYTYTTEERTLGNLFSFPVQEGDKVLKNGAKVLSVDGDFIRTLNADNNLEKLKKYKLPIHVVATEFKFCKLSIADCDRPTYFKKPAWMPAPSFVAKFNTAYTIYNFIFNQLPKAGDAFMKYMFDGENSDFVVPTSSMEVGMPYSYLTTNHELNIAHTTDFSFLGAEGVTSSPVILNKVITLLGQNVYDSKSNFSLDGINPPRRDNGTELEYHFLDFWKQDSVISNARISANEVPEGFKFYIDRADSLVNYKAGDTMYVSLMTSGVERAMLMFESENSDFWSTNETLVELEDTNVFMYVIPENYHGDFTITAYGANNQELVAVDTRLVSIQVPDSITLSKFYFTSQAEVIEMEQMQTYDVTLEGVYSNSTVRDFTTNPEVLYYLTDTTVAQFSGYSVKGLKQGKTYLIAVYDKKIDSLQFIVYDNPNLTKTIIGDFYVSVTASNELVFDWNTLQEYRTENIVVEVSENGTDFSELFTVAAEGTSYEQTNYLFKDAFESTTKMYYRLRIVDEMGSENLLSRIREVIPVDDVEVAAEEEVGFEANQLSIFPNPSKGGQINLAYTSKNTENAQVVIVTMQGQQILSQQVTIGLGENVIPIQLPNFVTPGMYIIQLSTSNDQFSKTISVNKE